MNKTPIAIIARTITLSFLIFLSASFYAQMSSLSTTFAGGNEFAGNMFDVNVKNSIVLQGFDINLGRFDGSNVAGTCDIKIFVKKGSYVGFETNAPAWTLIGSYEDVASAGTNMPTMLPRDLYYLLEKDSLYSFYITCSDLVLLSLVYTNGSAVGQIFSENSDLSIEIGIGRGVPDFEGSIFFPRTWNGTIHYTAASSIPTMGEWGLIILLLSMLILGVVYLRSFSIKKEMS